MIPLVDLAAQYRLLKSDIDAAIEAVLRDGKYVLGPAVESFERDFAEYCETSHAVGTNSGTSALHVALLAAGVRPGDEVITVPFTFIATVAAIEYTGAKPVLVDVEHDYYTMDPSALERAITPRTRAVVPVHLFGQPAAMADIEPDYYTMDPSALERAITPRTRAIVPVHLFGQPAAMADIVGIARRHRLVVIEDACQAHGAEHDGRRIGSLGDIGCFSFYPTKNLGAFGEGGAAVTNNSAYADSMRLLRSWGERRRYEHSMKGFNYRMDGVQGAILGVKLKHLDHWIDARRSHARVYGQLLADTAVCTPRERVGVRHVYQQYSVRLSQRDSWRTHLGEIGIQTAIHYPIPVHLQPAYRDLGHAAGDFPISETVAQEILSIPIFPEMTPTQIETVAGALRAGLPARIATA